MFIELRNAKRRFSELVKLAAEGEEIFITVRGQPIVKLTNAVLTANLDDRETWVDDLTEAAERETVSSPVATTQEYWSSVGRIDEGNHLCGNDGCLYAKGGVLSRDFVGRFVSCHAESAGRP